jgi:biotin transport system substrate-specific component
MFGDLQKSRKIAYSAAFIGLISLGAWVSIPFFPVPLTLQTLFVLLAGMILKRFAVIPVSLYVILGALGLPVFHAGVAGFGILLGPTGGYLVGFIGAALVVGLAYESPSQTIRITGLLAGTGVIYATGIAWLLFSLGGGLLPAITAGLIPFIPGELIKMYSAYAIEKRLP